MRSIEWKWLFSVIPRRSGRHPAPARQRPHGRDGRACQRHAGLVLGAGGPVAEPQRRHADGQHGAGGAAASTMAAAPSAVPRCGRRWPSATTRWTGSSASSTTWMPMPRRCGPSWSSRCTAGCGGRRADHQQGRGGGQASRQGAGVLVAAEVVGATNDLQPRGRRLDAGWQMVALNGGLERLGDRSVGSGVADEEFSWECPDFCV